MFTAPSATTRSLPSPAPLVLPGDAIHAPEVNTLRGHGTRQSAHDRASTLRATQAGVVERINKLVTVRALRGRYVPEVGDVVVGRVTQVQISSRRWRVDVQARQDAALLLSAIPLPGGVQRRRTPEDELNMRAVYAERDLISAEVQEVKADGTMMLHTRIQGRLGRLRQRGVLVAVCPAHIRRSTRHVVSLGYAGMAAVLGVNGYVWVYVESEATALDGGEDEEQEMAAEMPTDAAVGGVTAPSRPQALALCRVRNAILALDVSCFSISVESIRAVCRWSEAVPPADMLQPAFLERLQAQLAASA
ncbi:hypothetical protein CDCA_CDCA02G0608 [Cyanidium caldarium]|uniref:RRP4 S1 domain-containing protein n=1 Tax=Cyanidium caldarium TaxID=2771 RepID=A0AAV9IQQ1_CYACA|nr:hypothetical protein CDCA_CDCA02G0608 [Cyanidium caldarium]